MATVQLHTTHAHPSANTVVQALSLALHQCSSELQAAFEGADRARAAALSAQVLQQVATVCAACMPVPAGNAWVQALVLEVAFEPLAVQDDGTLVEDRFDVWIDYRAWPVKQTAVPVFFEQLLAGLRTTGQQVRWSCRSTGSGRATVQAWAALGA